MQYSTMIIRRGGRHPAGRSLFASSLDCNFHLFACQIKQCVSFVLVPNLRLSVRSEALNFFSQLMRVKLGCLTSNKTNQWGTNIDRVEVTSCTLFSGRKDPHAPH